MDLKDGLLSAVCVSGGGSLLIKKAQFIKVSQIHLIVTTEGAGGGTCPLWERQAMRLLLAPTCKINYA